MTVKLVQGETRSIPAMFADPDGDKVSATATSAIEATLADGALVLHAAFDAPAQANVDVVLDDGRGQKKTYTIAVTIDPIGWKKSIEWTSANGPIGREHGTFLIDETARTVMLIGGSGYQPQGMALDDFWKLDLASNAWTKVTPSGDVPPPTASARAVRLPKTTTAYLFGGYTGNGMTDTNELFRVEYGNGQLQFKKLVQTSPPPSRELHGFGFDPMTQTFAVFGGYSNQSGILSDTWIGTLAGDTMTWTKLAVTGPSPRYGFFQGTDEATGRYFVWSGAQKAKSGDPINAAQDGWALDLRAMNWTQVTDGTEPNHPKGRRNGCFVVDPRGPSLFIFGGTADGMTTEPGLAALDMRAGHEGFSNIDRPNSPVLRSSGFGFYDAVTGTVNCAFGNSTMGIYLDVTPIGP